MLVFVKFYYLIKTKKRFVHVLCMCQIWHFLALYPLKNEKKPSLEAWAELAKRKRGKLRINLIALSEASLLFGMQRSALQLALTL